jgi:hypothetical protein
MDAEPKIESSEALRKSCRHLMVDLDLDNRKRGAYSRMAEALSKRLGRTINLNVFAMALSGYRDTEYNRRLLVELQTMLLEWLAEAMPSANGPSDSGIIHGEN